MNGSDNSASKAVLLHPLRHVRDYAAFMMDETGNILSWNEGVEQILGFSESEFVGLNADLLFTPEDRLAGIPDRERNKARAEGWASDIRWHLRKNSTRFWATGSMSRVRDERGAAVGFIKIMRDSTETKQRQDELKFSEERFRVIVETANEAIVMLDNEGRIRFHNRQFNDLLDSPPGELTGRLFSDFICHADDEVIERCYSTSQNCGREQHELKLRRWNDSDFCWVLASVGPLSAASASGLLCFFADITGARKAAQELELNEARFRALVENSSGAITMMNPEGEVLYSSPALGRSLGYETEELIAMNQFSLIHPNDIEDLTERFRRLVSTPGGSTTGEYRLRRADGSYSWREGVATNLLDNPAVGAIVMNSHDVSERKHAEHVTQEALRLLTQEKHQVEQGSKEKSAYVANMSHEIRTPLTTIVGYAQMLMEQDSPDLAPETRRDIERIEAAGRHLLNLVDGILDLSKIEAGMMELQPQRFELIAMTREIAEQAQTLVTKNQNSLNLHLPNDPVPMTSDGLKLRQMLLNLLSNAAKFTQGGVIDLHVETGMVADQPGIRIIVRDTGEGMTSHQLTSLFEPYRSFGNDSSFQKGTGLGLFLTRRLCHLMGGDLLVESQRGGGSTFTLSLPLNLRMNDRAQ